MKITVVMGIVISLILLSCSGGGTTIEELEQLDEESSVNEVAASGTINDQDVSVYWTRSSPGIGRVTADVELISGYIIYGQIMLNASGDIDNDSGIFILTATGSFDLDGSTLKMVFTLKGRVDGGNIEDMTLTLLLFVDGVLNGSYGADLNESTKTEVEDKRDDAEEADAVTIPDGDIFDTWVNDDSVLIIDESSYSLIGDGADSFAFAYLNKITSSPEEWVFISMMDIHDMIDAEIDYCPDDLEISMVTAGKVLVEYDSLSLYPLVYDDPDGGDEPYREYFYCNYDLAQESLPALSEFKLFKFGAGESFIACGSFDEMQTAVEAIIKTDANLGGVWDSGDNVSIAEYIGAWFDLTSSDDDSSLAHQEHVVLLNEDGSYCSYMRRHVFYDFEYLNDNEFIPLRKGSYTDLGSGQILITPEQVDIVSMGILDDIDGDEVSEAIIDAVSPGSLPGWLGLRTETENEILFPSGNEWGVDVREHFEPYTETVWTGFDGGINILYFSSGDVMKDVYDETQGDESGEGFRTPNDISDFPSEVQSYMY